MDEYPVWYRQFISTVVTQHLQHNLHLLATTCWLMSKTSYKRDDFITDRLAHTYGGASKDKTVEAIHEMDAETVNLYLDHDEADRWLTHSMTAIRT